MNQQFHTLKVLRVEYPIKAATTITFEVPADLKDLFHYYPGQHLVIKFKVDGQEHRRSYSLNSCPFKTEPLQVTVKRVEQGLISNYIGDHLQAGDELEVMLPQGRFFADIQPEAYKTYFLFAAGSGITPILSILQSVLIAAPQSRVILFYGNTDQESILFKAELDEWEGQYPQRLQVVHTLSNPKVWSTWEQWKGRKGRVDAESVEWFITHHPPVAQNTEYYICGPGAMNLTVRQTLMDLGIPKALIHLEQFGAEGDDQPTSIKGAKRAELRVSLRGKSHQLLIPEGETILATLKAAEVDPPYSCESGVCGTCVARVIKGQAEMKACMALEEEELRQGLILTCQALPLSEEITLEFDQE